MVTARGEVHPRRLVVMTVLLATAAFLVSPGVGSVAASHPGTPSYTDLDGMSMWQEGEKGALWFLVDAKGAIPRHPDEYVNSVGAFGYVWLYRTEEVGIPEGVVDFNVGFLAHIHPYPPFGWHLHQVFAGASRTSGPCTSGYGLFMLHEVGPFRTSGDGLTTWCLADFDESIHRGGIVIVGDTMRIRMPSYGASLSSFLNPCRPYGCIVVSYAVASFIS